MVIFVSKVFQFDILEECVLKGKNKNPTKTHNSAFPQYMLIGTGSVEPTHGRASSSGRVWFPPAKEEKQQILFKKYISIKDTG